MKKKYLILLLLCGLQLGIQLQGSVDLAKYVVVSNGLMVASLAAIGARCTESSFVTPDAAMKRSNASELTRKSLCFAFNAVAIGSFGLGVKTLLPSVYNFVVKDYAPYFLIGAGIGCAVSYFHKKEQRKREEIAEREDLMVIIAATKEDLTRLRDQNLSLQDLRSRVHYGHNRLIDERCFESGKFGWFLVRRIQASSRRRAEAPNLMQDILAAEERYSVKIRREDAEAAAQRQGAEERAELERRRAAAAQRQREATEAQRVEQERREREEQVSFPVYSRLDNPELQYCPVCGEGGADTVLIEDEEKGTVDQQREKYKKYTLPCTHLLCKDCIIGIKKARDRAGLERDLSCPTCRVFFRLTQDF